MVRHRFNLRVKHGMEDKTLHLSRLGSLNKSLADNDLVRADIGADVIDCPRSLGGSSSNRLVTHIANQDILNT